MTIRRFIFPVGVLLLAVLLVVWLRVDRDGDTGGLFVEKNSEVPSARESATESRMGDQVADDTKARELGRQEMLRREEEKRKEIVGLVINSLNTSINFYGRIIDQHGEPVPDADINFKATDKFMESGSGYQGKSDADGYFSLSGVKGAALGVGVRKKGYYQIDGKSNGYFAYGVGVDSERRAPPTKKEPAIFFLHKMGEAVQLVRLKNVVEISKKGNPVEIRLDSWALAENGQGDIIIQAWSDYESGQLTENYNWKFIITVPNGGLVENNTQFDFEAPLGGYKEFDEIIMMKDDSQWKRRFEKEYFLRLSRNNYARISLTYIPGGGHFIHFESYLNPEPGNRNLEADPNKLIEIRPR